MSKEIATRDKVTVGTVLTYAISYSARIPVFVRVTNVTRSTFTVEELKDIVVSHDGYGQNGTCIADLESPGTPIKKRHRFNINGNVYIDKHTCYIYDGDPEDFYTD